jgi:vesicle-fusing ATPase
MYLRKSKASGFPVSLTDPVINVQISDLVFLAAPYGENLAEGEIGMNTLQRDTGSFQLQQSVSMNLFVPSADVALSGLTFAIELLGAGKVGAPPVTIECDELSESFKAQFNNQVFTLRQNIAMDFNGIKLKLSVDGFEHADLNVTPSTTTTVQTRGQVLNVTSISFIKKTSNPNKPLLLKGNSGPSRNESLFKREFNFEALEIGGLGEQFKTMFRRAFASRIFPGLTQQMGMTHVKGILLYGPPGCGKTLIARKIGEVLNAKAPKIINGPEILDKFVGESERKVRK